MLARSALCATRSARNTLKVVPTVLRSFSSIPVRSTPLPKVSVNPGEKCVTIDCAPKEEEKMAVIMLHGLGDTGFFMAPYAYDLALGLHSASFFCPTAPMMPITCRANAKHHAWFDFPTWDENGNNKCVGVDSSVELVNKWIQHYKDMGFESKNIYLCGFSQGGGIALHAGLQREDPLGGVIAFCGCLPNDHTFSVNPNCKDTPVMLYHGTADHHVPVSFMMKAIDIMSEKGAKNVSLSTYPGIKHQITGRMVSLTRNFLVRQESKITKQ